MIYIYVYMYTSFSTMLDKVLRKNIKKKKKKKSGEIGKRKTVFYITSTSSGNLTAISPL